VSINTLILSFNDGMEGGSKISWTSCCGSSNLENLDENIHDNNELLKKSQNKLKYCIQTCTNKKPRLIALSSVKLLQEDTHKPISLDYSSEKNIQLYIDDESHWAPRCVRAGTITLSNDDLADFLNKTENATFGFFTVKIKESNSIYLMAILNDIVG
jgi:hypothetical protein